MLELKQVSEFSLANYLDVHPAYIKHGCQCLKLTTNMANLFHYLSLWVSIATDNVCRIFLK